MGNEEEFKEEGGEVIIEDVEGQEEKIIDTERSEESLSKEEEHKLKAKLKKSIRKEFEIEIKPPDDIKTYTTRTRFRYNFRSIISPYHLINNVRALDGSHSLYSMVRLTGFNSLENQRVFAEVLEDEAKGYYNFEGSLRYVVYKKRPTSLYSKYVGEVIEELVLEWHKDKGQIVGLAFIPDI
jgi:hypothetical protein